MGKINLTNLLVITNNCYSKGEKNVFIDFTFKFINEGKLEKK